MHRPWFLFSLLLAMCFIVSALFFVEERPHEDRGEGDHVHRVYLGHGTPHSVFPTMQQGGDGRARHGHLQWVGWVLATLMVVFAVACLAFGAAKRGRPGPMGRPIMAGALVYVLLFMAIFVSYHSYWRRAASTVGAGENQRKRSAAHAGPA